MAGSFNHVITDAGNLRSSESFTNSIENLGDAYEAIEEMYGMIWWIASVAPDAAPIAPEELVEMARKNYAIGLQLAKNNKSKRKDND